MSMKWKKLYGLFFASSLLLSACGDPEDCATPGDEDEDGQADCADDECSTLAICNPVEDCDVIGDEDGNGLSDCADPACAAEPQCGITCPNGTIDAGEDCDGNNLDNTDCTDLNDPEGQPFIGGTLACNANCNFDVALCTEAGTEICDNGINDNDGDNLVDCADPDCVAALNCIETNNCDDSIDNDGDGLVDCADVAQCAADVACTETGAECQGGVDDDGDGLIDCLDPDCAADLACDNCGNSVLDAGEECDGANLNNGTCSVATGGAQPVGTLACDAACQFDTAGCSAVVCNNDGVVDAAEQCDDGVGGVSNGSGDGCDDCAFTPDFEQELNNDQATANVFTAIDVVPAGGDGQIKGFVNPSGDVDFFRITVPAGTADVRVETLDGPAGTLCLGFNLDSELDLFDAAGALIDNDDDGGVDFCSLALGNSLPAGDYFIRVKASDFDPTLTFDYTLSVIISPIACGNADVQTGELCDDGNTTASDGCEADCLSITPNFACTGDPSVCHPIVCGDGIIDAGEQCEPATQGAICDPATCLFLATPGTEPNDDTIPNTAGGNGNDFHNGFCEDGTTACNVANQNQNCAGIDLDANGQTVCALHNDPTVVIANGPFNTGDGNVLISESFAVAGDEDTFSVFNNGTNPVQVTAETFGPGGPGTCVGVDSEINFRNAAGAELANDDEGGIGSCSLETFIVAPGQFTFVHVIDFGDNTVVASYFAQLRFQEIVCGDGVVSLGEQCEPPTGGCDPATCLFIAVAEIEPNDDTVRNINGGNGNDFHNGFCDDNTTACNVANAAQNCGNVDRNGDGTPDGIIGIGACTAHNDATQVLATGPFNTGDGNVLITGAFNVAGDEDTFSVTNNGTNLVRLTAETFSVEGPGSCLGGLDTEINIRNAAGAELANDDDGGINNCSLETFGIAPGETLFVHTIDFGDSTLVGYNLQLRFVDVVCNDGAIEAGIENCEDGNTTDGDGCSSVCLAEPGFICNNTTLPSVCTPSCGDGIINSTDQCDGAALGGNDCLDFPSLNNGVLACAVDCTFDTTGCVASVCGNNVIENGEECETPGVGACDAACQLIAVSEVEANDDTIPNTAGGNGNDFHNGFCDNGTTACNVANGAQNCVVGTGSPAIVTTTCTAHNDATLVNADGPFATSAGDALVFAGLGVAGDEDTFAVINDGPTLVRLTAETFGPGGVGTCVGFDSEINIRNAAGAELANDDEGGIGSCSLETFAIAPGETLFVHVIDFGDNTAIPSYFLQIRFQSIVCNDGAIEAGIENCEDGNTTDGDGCSSVCLAEPGFICNNTTLPSVCTPSCGDGIINSTDVCDGAALGGNDCTDFGLNGAGLACLADCTGFDTSACVASVCGNGVVEVGEQCEVAVQGAICDGATCLFISTPEVEANDDTIRNTAGGNGNDFHNGFCEDGTTACNVANQNQNCAGIDLDANGQTVCALHNDATLVNSDGPFATGDGSVLISAAFDVAGDEDTFAVFNDGTNLVRLTAETFGPGGPGTCVGVDSEINIRNAAGAELANDDEGGIGSCSLETFGIAPGETLFVHTIDFGDNTVVASYFLQLSFEEIICGDGIITAGIEACDDGNTVDNDGCSSVCQVETGFDCNNATPPSVCTALFACGAGETLVTFSAVNVPVAIPDNPTVLNVLSIADAGTITKAFVVLDNLQHTFDADLDIFLLSPNAISVELSTDNGAGNDNFINTTFSEDCATPVTAGAAPFTGCFNPEGDLNTLVGQSITGDWTLSIDDDLGGDTGTLNDWTLAFCVQ